MLQLAPHLVQSRLLGRPLLPPSSLAGFGYSDKLCPLHRHEPLPAATSTGEAGLFTFHTWSRQLRAFIREVVGESAVLLCNSGEG